MSKNSKITLPKGTKVPDHIAIVLDGNRRWARSRGLPSSDGHQAGYKAMKRVAKASRDLGVHTLTIWGFSTENWERSAEETANIMSLVRKFLSDFDRESAKEKVRLVHLGREDRLPKDIIDEIERLEDKTKGFKKHVLNIALDYGGRDEIVRAIRKIIDSKIPSGKVDEKLFASYLDTGDQPYPYPDLFIRTSGEQRDSGLLPWQMVYAEYYWEIDHLPDFTPEKLREAVLDYSRRRRRFGGNDELEHFKFDPKMVAKLELGWRHALAIGEGERFRDLVVRYVREHYGLSRVLARKAGFNLAEAILNGKKENWEEAKNALLGLYEIIRKTLGLALEPDLVATLEISLWRANGSAEKTAQGLKVEEILRKLYAEIYRVSDLQMSKAAHLAALATSERDQAEKASGVEANAHWKRAQWYMERFYKALKERIA